MPDEVADNAFTTPSFARRYNCMDWYWLADDGRVFASERQLTVTESDADYIAFIAGGPATPWPRDDAGQQTDAALQAVFDSYDIKVGGVPLDINVSSKPPSKQSSSHSKK